MLVQKWAILRAPMPRGITVRKVIALVNALMKLHNFCIDQKVDTTVGGDDKPMRQLTVDSFHLMNGIQGFIELDQVAEGVIPTQLLGAGHHRLDVPREVRESDRDPNLLPRKELHDKVVNSHKVRPSGRRPR